MRISSPSETSRVKISFVAKTSSTSSPGVRTAALAAAPPWFTRSMTGTSRVRSVAAMGPTRRSETSGAALLTKARLQTAAAAQHRSAKGSVDGAMLPWTSPRPKRRARTLAAVLGANDASVGSSLSSPQPGATALLYSAGNSRR